MSVKIYACTSEQKAGTTCLIPTWQLVSGVLTMYRHLEPHMPWTPPDVPKKSVVQAPGPAGGGRAALRSPARAGTWLSHSWAQ